MIAILLAYLIGSLPIAWIATKLRTGADIRRLGTGNVGVMNSALQGGRLAGLIVLLGEAGKGFAAVALTRAFELDPLLTGLTVAAAVFGTQRMIWLGGAGGRGNTCGAAALLVLSPHALAAGLGVWMLVRLISRSSFVATRAALLAWPLLFGLISESWVQAACVGLICGLYLYVQRPETDDHTRMKQRWASAWEFIRGGGQVGTSTESL